MYANIDIKVKRAFLKSGKINGMHAKVQAGRECLGFFNNTMLPLLSSSFDLSAEAVKLHITVFDWRKKGAQSDKIHPEEKGPINSAGFHMVMCHCRKQ